MREAAAASATARITHLEGDGLPREGFDENLHPGVGTPAGEQGADVSVAVGAQTSANMEDICDICQFDAEPLLTAASTLMAEHEKRSCAGRHGVFSPRLHGVGGPHSAWSKIQQKKYFVFIYRLFKSLVFGLTLILISTYI